MAWQKGQSGNLKGRPTSEKAFADMLRIAVKGPHKVHGTKLRAIAEVLADQAVLGEGWAIQQVADRLDGKAAQESTVTIDDKRDATDWTRSELVAFLRDATADCDGTPEKDGRGGEPDSVH